MESSGNSRHVKGSQAAKAPKPTLPLIISVAVCEKGETRSFNPHALRLPKDTNKYRLGADLSTTYDRGLGSRLFQSSHPACLVDSFVTATPGLAEQSLGSYSLSIVTCCSRYSRQNVTGG